MNLPELRQAAQSIWEAALAAANPAACIRGFVHAGEDAFSIGGLTLARGGRLIVIGAGKASARMAQAVEEILGSRIGGGLVVTKYGHSLPLRTIRVAEAGHPIPDSAGIQAVLETRRLLAGLSPEDLVLCLISGGGSALWPAPAEGVTLEEKAEVTSLLLRAGAAIREVNAVRKHLSAMKGGQLARWAAPARVVSLIMSDVIGDPLDFIASGPTAPDTTTFADAVAILDKYGIAAPRAVQDRLQAGAQGRIEDTAKPGDPLFRNVQNHIIANNRLLIDSALVRARQLNFNTLVLASEIEGEAREAGRFFAAIAREAGSSGRPVQAPACILAAGETTVTVRGPGAGGRNQEMAVAWADAMAVRPPDSPVCFASVATDGSDGPTDAAGGLVDAGTCSRALERGLAPADALRANDSFHFLKAAGDLIVTGPTQTNLMDLQILLIG